YDYLTASAYRQRGDGGPDIYSDFKKVIYVDRLPPVSAIGSFAASGNGGSLSTSRTATVKSVDQTANNIHAFLNLPANLTNAQIIAMVSGPSQAAQADVDLWNRNFTSVA